MKNKKILSFIIITFIAFFFGSTNVFASKDYAECYYNLPIANNAKISINFSDGKIIGGVKLYEDPMSNNSIRNQVVSPSQFYDASQKLLCPQLFYKVTVNPYWVEGSASNTGSQYFIDVSTIASENEYPKLTDRITTKNVVRPGTEVSDKIYCTYTFVNPRSTTQKLTYTIIKSEGHIVANPTDLNLSRIAASNIYVDEKGECNQNVYFDCSTGSAERPSCFATMDKDTTKATSVNSVSLINADANIVAKYNEIVYQELNCESLTPLLEFLNMIYRTVVVLLMIALVVFGMIDFAQAAMSSNADAMKKATKKFATRALIVIIIFLLPALLNMLFSIVTQNGATEFKTCLPK